jgi:uncharacterized membrane protein
MSAETTDRRFNWILGLAVIATGLQAGLYYAFAVAVLPGLSDADDRTLIDAMQQINDAIENPALFLTFLGAPALALAAAVLSRRYGTRELMGWVVAGLALAVVGIVVTGAFSLPLNDDLAAAGDPGRIGDVTGVRDDYVGPWVAWNIVRALAFTGAFACLARAIFARPAVPPPGATTATASARG